MNQDLVIVGTGGFAREVHQLVEDSNAQESRWNVLGFLDDDPARAADVHGLPVLGPLDWLLDRSCSVSVGVGSPRARRRIVRRLAEVNSDLAFPTLLHPLAWVGNRISIGAGTIVCAGSMLTTDLRLGAHVIVNLDCTIGHDCEIADFVTFAPSVNVSGAVTIGEGCDVGTGACLIQGVHMGEWGVMGAGAVATQDVAPNVTAVGVPAKVIKERTPGWHEVADG